MAKTIMEVKAGVVMLDPELVGSLEEQYSDMTPTERKRLSKSKKGLPLPKAILRIMCAKRLAPQQAAELMVKELQSGAGWATGIPQAWQH
jgi:hypothetical protein